MSPFEKAFAAARKAGKKEFSFNGKKYHTKLKEEVSSSSSTIRPKRNPNRPPSVQSEAPKMEAGPTKAKPVVIKTAAAKTASKPAPKATSPRPRARPEPVKKGGISDGGTIFKDFFKKGGLSDRKKK